MREASYQDATGRWWAVLLPETAGDWEAPQGVPVGPPDSSKLGLPDEIAVRLHNELYARRLFRLQDVGGRMQDINSALISALRVDAQVIAGLYSG